MKFVYAIGAAFALFVITLWFFLPQSQPCANARDTSMGRSLEAAPASGLALQWHKTCASGMRWTKP